MTNRLTNWVPFRIAYELPSLKKGALNIGNTQQNKANLLALAIVQANSGLGITGWARWKAGFGGTNNPSLGRSTTSGAGLLLNVSKVPGYTPPVGTND
jgi:hypothetical protein